MALECVSKLGRRLSRDLAFVDLVAQQRDTRVESKVLQQYPGKQWLGALISYAEGKHGLFLFPEVLDGLVVEEAEELGRSRQQLGAVPISSDP